MNKYAKIVLKILKYSSILGISILILILALMIALGAHNENVEEKGYHENKFDQELWLNGNGACTRGSMYYDLVNNNLKLGMTQNNVEKLLGKPAFSYIPKKYKKESDIYCLVYHLGACGHPAGPRALKICFKNGIMIDFYK